MAVPSPNQPPGGTPVNVMVWPWALSLLILSSPSTTPNQYVTGLPTRHTKSPGRASPTNREATARVRAAG